ncbi:serine hydrolase domain-containing protein [Acidobacteriota bacterium]
MKLHRGLHKLSVIFALIALSVVFLSADTKTKKVDKLFAKWSSTISPGAALAIIQDGKIIYTRGYGMANLEQNIPITSKTVFRIGSTSKQFTAACIAILSLQGKISLDDDIRKYVPEIPKYEKTITVRHLVHHTSGLRDYLVLAMLSGLTDDNFYSTDDTVAQLSRQKGWNFPPGEEHLYCNSGYFLMGEIVKRVSGKSLNDFAQEHIFKPLGMHNTHFHDDYTMIVKNRADGHAHAKGGFKINNTTLNHVGDGGIFTTVEDLYLWDQAFYNNKLGKELMDLMHQTGVLNNGEKLEYAFGLMVSEHKGLKLVAHGGAFVGFRADMIRFPEEKFSVICLANLGSIDPSKLCKQVADIYLTDKFTEKGPAVKPAEEITPVTLTKEDLDNKTGTYYAEKSSLVARVSVKKNQLRMTAMGFTVNLIPLSKTKFISKDAPVNVTIVFSPASGEVKEAHVAIEGYMETDLKKAPKMAPMTTEELETYAGSYYNEELPATYKLVVDKDKLFFKHRNAPKSPLKIIDKDRFTWQMGTLQFTRGKDQQITGFSLDAGRVRIQFTKQ